MTSTPDRIIKQRDIIDRTALADKIESIVAEDGPQRGRPQILELLQGALADGRAEIKRRLGENP